MTYDAEEHWNSFHRMVHRDKRRRRWRKRAYLAIIIVIALSAAIMASGCSVQRVDQPAAYTVELYSGGKVIGAWTTAVVHRKSKADYCYFRCDGKRVYVCGTYIIREN